MLDAADLPNDIAELKAMLIAATALELRKDECIERLEKLVAAFKQAAFGRKSEKSDPEQFDLALEDLETAIAAIHAEDEADTAPNKRVSKPRAANRGLFPNICIALVKISASAWMSSRHSSVSLSPVAPNMHAAPAATALCKPRLRHD